MFKKLRTKIFSEKTIKMVLLIAIVFTVLATVFHSEELASDIKMGVFNRQEAAELNLPTSRYYGWPMVITYVKVDGLERDPIGALPFLIIFVILPILFEVFANLMFWGLVSLILVSLVQVISVLRFHK